MIRIHVASANSSSANTMNRPASGSETVWGGSPRPVRPARGRSAISLSICPWVFAASATSMRSVSSSKVSQAGHEVLAQLGHGGVALDVANPEVVVVTGGPGHAPARYKLLTRLPRVGIVF